MYFYCVWQKPCGLIRKFFHYIFMTVIFYEGRLHIAGQPQLLKPMLPDKRQGFFQASYPNNIHSGRLPGFFLIPYRQ